LALLLLLETATTACSVGISENGKLLAIREINEGFSHAENLTLFCKSVLDEIGFSFDSLDGIVLSKGPGSYTGLRIGSATAKGYCYALSIPLLSVPTLQHMALQISKQGKFKEAFFCPMIDARRMEVYCALYDSANKELMPTEAKIIDENSFSAVLSERVIVFFGDGAHKCKPYFEANKNAIFIDGIFPSAREMAELGEEKFKAKAFEDSAYFEPYYLKDFIAGGLK